MEISLLALQLAVIFLPGIFWARLDAAYGSRSQPTEREFFLRALMFGLASYAATFVVFAILGWPFSVFDPNAKAIVTPAVASEIVCALGVSFILGLLWLYATNYKLLTRLLLKIGATKNYSDADVWEFTFNNPETAVKYVQLRDFANRLVYAGWVNTFSDSEKLRELLLKEVCIFDFEGRLLYEMPALYIARRPEEIHIEFPELQNRRNT